MAKLMSARDAAWRKIRERGNTKLPTALEAGLKRRAEKKGTSYPLSHLLENSPITKLRNAEKQIKTSRNKWRNLYDDLPKLPTSNSTPLLPAPSKRQTVLARERARLEGLKTQSSGPAIPMGGSVLGPDSRVLPIDALHEEALVRNQGIDAATDYLNRKNKAPIKKAAPVKSVAANAVSKEATKEAAKEATEAAAEGAGKGGGWGKWALIIGAGAIVLNSFNNRHGSDNEERFRHR